MTTQRLHSVSFLKCFCCDQRWATHVRRFTWNELRVQVCLCPECLEMDVGQLARRVLGRSGIAAQGRRGNGELGSPH
jgi:hypothetical protein